MIQILEFIFRDVWTFLGTFLFFATGCETLRQCFRSLVNAPDDSDPL